MDILINTGVGFLGIMLYALLTAKDKNDTDTLSFTGYFRTNWVKWIIALLIIVVVSVLIKIVPDGSMAIKTVTGLDVTSEASFITMGYVLVSAGRKINIK